MDLFDTAKADYEPLASRMRPRNLEEYIGQEHILGQGRLLRRAISRDQLSSLIFYGPPGTGKTTLARVIANSTKSHFLSLNAVLSGVKDIRENIERASLWRKMDGKRTILFVDEVHRWNKSQQDALLPQVENGTFILIGATTENPYFEVNSALVSRSRVFQLLPLGEDELSRIAWQALADPLRGYGKWKVSFSPGAMEHLVEIAHGDARSLLNALELAVETSCEKFPPPEGTELHISLADAEESIQKKVVLYDKDGDYHFDTISAFIKSLRGSDPDAALYWLAKMVRAGEDPAFLFRRMLISACEDVGLADPQALVVVDACSRAFERIGMPEGQYHLTQAALYLATAPKSNSALGYFDALKAVEKQATTEVPQHLKDGSRDKKSFGHGENYKYPHAFRDHWVAQQYLPSGLQDTFFYHPGTLGYEGTVRDQTLRRRELFLAARDDDREEIRTYSPEESWKRRLEINSGVFLDTWRQFFMEKVGLVRHYNVLVAADLKSLLLFEALRRVPEGQVAAIGYSARDQEELSAKLSFLPELNEPLIQESLLELPQEITYERILFWNPQSALEDVVKKISDSIIFLAPGGKIYCLFLSPPLSLLPPDAIAFAYKESEFLSLTRPDYWKFSLKDWGERLPEFQVTQWEILEGREEIQPSTQTLDQWLSPEREKGWGSQMSKVLSESQWSELQLSVRKWWSGGPKSWQRSIGILEMSKTGSMEQN